MQNPDIWSDKDKVSKIGQEIKEKKEILEKLNSWIQLFNLFALFIRILCCESIKSIPVIYEAFHSIKFISSPF